LKAYTESKKFTERSRNIGLRFLFASLGLILPIFLFEIGARALAVNKLSDQDRFAVVNEHQLNPDDANLWCNPDQSLNADAVKIFAFGGSSVFGCCGTVSLQQAFPAELERKLASSGKYAVRSYALSGRDSFYHHRCVERLTLAGAQARYWVYYAGHNDYINGRVGFPHISIFLQKHPVVFRGINWTLKNMHLAGLLRNFSYPAFPSISSHKFAENKATIFEEYARNVEATHSLIKAAGGKIILITVVSNLEHPPIFREAHGPDSDPRENALALFEQGMAQKRTKPLESLKILKAARDWDRSTWRAPSEVNQFLRALAAKNPDSIHLIDLEEKLDSVFPREGIGCNFFGEGNYCDHLHPNLRLHREIAEHLRQAVIALERESKAAI